MTKYLFAILICFLNLIVTAQVNDNNVSCRANFYRMNAYIEDTLKISDSIRKYEKFDPAKARLFLNILDSNMVASGYDVFYKKIYDTTTKKYIDSYTVGFRKLIPDTMAKGTRMGNLKLGQSVDIYTMRPLFMFFDSSWFYYYEELHGKEPPPPRNFQEPCQYKDFRNYKGNYVEGYCNCKGPLYNKFCNIYDVDTSEVYKLIVPRDQFYWMFRKITIRREECHYMVIFYKDKFIKPEDTFHLNQFKNLWFNRPINWQWQQERQYPTFFADWPEIHGDYRNENVHRRYNRFLCQMEKIPLRKKWETKFPLNEKRLRNPMEKMLPYYQHHWFIMDFHDSNNYRTFFTGEQAEQIGLYKPWHSFYWRWGTRWYNSRCIDFTNLGRSQKAMWYLSRQGVLSGAGY